MSFHVGETFGDYQITGIIGAGSMGQVFQAEHRLTKRVEAVKVIATELAAARQIQRFQREIAVQAGLNHPNIAAVHNALQVDGKFVLVMEFVQGHTLETLLQTGGLLVDVGLDYIAQTLSALSYAHARGVIHRDVTPANLIITPNGTVKLTDFGVAKAFGDVELTNYGEVVGSLQYMAPEQIGGNSPPDPRSDLYSVGAILYEIVAGRKPFEEKTVLHRLAGQEPEPKRPTEANPNLSSKWDAIILRALAKDPAERYQSADEFLRALPGVKPAQALGGSVRGVKPSTLVTALSIASAIALAFFAATGSAVSRFRVPPPPQAVTFRIAPPEWPAARPVTNARTNVRARATTKKRTARHIPKKASPFKKDLPPSGAEASTVPTPQQTTVESRVPAAELQPVQQEAPQATPPESPSPIPAPAPKKRIWSKLNLFRKKKAETALGPSHN